MVKAEEFEPALTEFGHKAGDFFGRNFVIPDGIRCDVLGGESLGDESVLPGEYAAAFAMRLAPGVGQEFAVDFAAAANGALHFREYITGRIREVEQPI